jgi:hypothetical protein
MLVASSEKARHWVRDDTLSTASANCEVVPGREWRPTRPRMQTQQRLPGSMKLNRPLRWPSQNQRRPPEGGRYKFNGCGKGNGAQARLPACSRQAYATRRVGLGHRVYRQQCGGTLAGIGLGWRWREEHTGWDAGGM